MNMVYQEANALESKTCTKCMMIFTIIFTISTYVTAFLVGKQGLFESEI